MLPFSQTIEAIHCALSLKGCTWACFQAFSEKFYSRKNNCLLCYFKIIGIVDVNLSRRWGERRYVCESWKQYMYHKSSPLSHTKAPKIELIVQLLKSNFISWPRGIPPIADCYIPSICQRNGIFEFITQCFMLSHNFGLIYCFVCLSINGL
jgi:hypothetical protein